MKAIPFEKACKADHLKITEWETPKITQDDEVIVRVRAFGLNFADTLARKGQYGDAPPHPFIPGYECAGVVVAIGAKVDNVKIGDKVIVGSFDFGSYAQYVKVIKAAVVLLPDSWTFAQGAGVLVTSITAYHSIFATGYTFPGDKILIHACAGGVGLAAVQIALHAKLEIFGTCGSDEKMKMLKEKGVHHPINYNTQDFEDEIKKLTNGQGVDIIIDSVGGSYFKKDIHSLSPNGRVIGIGAAIASDRSLSKMPSLVSGVVSMMTINSIDLMLSSKGFMGVNMKRIANYKQAVLQKELSELYQLFQSGIVKPEVLTELPWTEVVKAHQMLETRQSTGKIVLTIPENDE